MSVANLSHQLVTSSWSVLFKIATFWVPLIFPCRLVNINLSWFIAVCIARILMAHFTLTLSTVANDVIKTLLLIHTISRSRNLRLEKEAKHSLWFWKRKQYQDLCRNRWLSRFNSLSRSVRLVWRAQFKCDKSDVWWFWMRKNYALTLIEQAFKWNWETTAGTEINKHLWRASKCAPITNEQWKKMFIISK